MADLDGTPLWYELSTTDADGAQAFYAEVVGWSIAPFTGVDAVQNYRILTAPEGLGVGGLTALSRSGPMKAGWYGYFSVQDVDATASRVTTLGGTVHVTPRDIPGVGRFAMVADPQGLPFYVMRGDSPQASRAYDPISDGHCSWHELVTSDHGAALAFYGELFGWRNDETMSMGPMGDYCFLDHANRRIGATMTAGPGFPTRWTYYFRVPSIAAAATRVASAGGAVTQGPHEVPGGDHIVHGIDPQGAAFALVGGA